MSKPRVLFINRSYWPDAEATGQLLTELCESLTADYEIHVIAGQPNSNPDQQVYKKYGWEVNQGVNVHRVWHTQFSKSSGAGRMINLCSFFFMAIWKTFFLPRMSIIVMETDPFLLPLGTPFIRLSQRSKIIYYLQDIYPDIAIAVKVARNSWLIKLLRNMLFANYKKADAVVVLSEDMKKLCLQYDIPAETLHVIPNWCRIDEITPRQTNNILRAEYPFHDKFLVMHSGNMGMSQNLERILEVANTLKNHQHIHFMLVGGGAQEKRLRKLADELQLKNLTFHPYQPKHLLAESLSSADLHIISSDPEAIKCLMPCKLYGILASGSPVIGIVDPQSELAQIITLNECGKIVRNESIQEIANSILDFSNHPESLQKMSQNARTYAEKNCDLRHTVNMFTQLFRNLLESEAKIPQAA